MAPHPGHALFVGRAHELAGLMDRLNAAAQGDSGLVLIAGEPGIGKTRLTDQFAQLARGSGWVVLLGRTYESEGMPSYLPVIEALRGYIRTCPPSDLFSRLGRGAAAVMSLLPEVHEVLPNLPILPGHDPEHERYWLFEGICDSLVSIGEGATGVLLVLDDLHWADKPTLLLLQHLVRRLTATHARVLVTGTYRTADLNRTQPLAGVLAALSHEHLSERVLLGALSVEESAALIQHLSGDTAAPAVVQAIFRETEGNPFFIEEVVRHLQAEARDLTDPNATISVWGIPEGVRQAIGSRLARLSRTANQMLQTGTVLGDGFSYDVLQLITGIPDSEFLDALDEALSAGILREAAQAYHFTHSLIRQSLYHELSFARRQRLHLRAAEAIEQVHGRNLTPYLATLAGHYRLAGAAADPEKTITCSLRAADAAAAVFAWEETAIHLSTALECLEELGTADGTRLYEMLTALGSAQMKAGMRPEARTTLRQAAAIAREQEEPVLLARVALSLGGTGPEPLAVDQTLLSLLQEALRTLPAEEQVLRARVLARLAAELRQDEIHGKTALSAKALDLAQQVGDPEALAMALDARYAALQGPDHLDEQPPLSGQMLRLATETRNVRLAWRGHICAARDRLAGGDVPSVNRELKAAGKLAECLRQPQITWGTLVHQAMSALLAGHFAEAEQLVREVSTLGQRLQSESALLAHTSLLFALRREQGRLDEAEAALQAMALRYREPHSLHGAVALLNLELGREQEARRAFEQLAMHNFTDIPLDAGWIGALALYAEACAGLGDTRRAQQLYSLLLPYAGRVSPVSPSACVCRGAVAYYLGLLVSTLRRWDAATQHFEHAIAMHTSMGARPLLAHTRRQFGQMLLVRRPRGDLRRARQLLNEALIIYDDLEMGHYADNVRTLLADPRLAALSTAARTHPGGLSARELDVLRLIAEGRSNGEIAGDLVLSRRTVERHVSNIYARLALHGRADAMHYAFTHGLTQHDAPGSK